MSDMRSVALQDPTPRLVEQVESFLRHQSAVKFAYLFGSRARGEAGPLSDLDIAVYLDRRLNVFNCRLKLMEQLAAVLGHEHFDLVTLNDAPLTLQCEVVREGKVLKEAKARRVAFEARVLSFYLDAGHLRETQRIYLKEQLTGRVGRG